MSTYDITLKEEDLVDLMSKNDGMVTVLTSLINQVMDMQCAEQLKAAHYERTDQRADYRNGYRTRTLYTRVGPLTLRVPQTRNGTFSTDIFNKYQRSEKALVLSLMEMYLQGVSTRKVKKITEELCGTQFSKSHVSQLSTGLDAMVNAWKTRPLSEWTAVSFFNRRCIGCRRAQRPRHSQYSNAHCLRRQ